MQKYLEGLTALHSADMQANDSRSLGRAVRRDPVTTEHPLVRVNPVTGWKSLFFNPGFVTKIVGIPKIENDAVIRYLSEIIATTQEAHVRFQWNKNDVAFWDNRVTVSPTLPDPHSYRLTSTESLCLVWLCSPSSPCCPRSFPRRSPRLRPSWHLSRGGIRCTV